MLFSWVCVLFSSAHVQFSKLFDAKQTISFKLPNTLYEKAADNKSIVGVIPKEGLVRPRLPNPRYPMTMTKILQDKYLWHTPHNYKPIMLVDCS